MGYSKTDRQNTLFGRRLSEKRKENLVTLYLLLQKIYESILEYDFENQQSEFKIKYKQSIKIYHYDLA